ncbi:MAG: TRAP transporter large permease [Hyphomicrobiaceae bacterium]
MSHSPLLLVLIMVAVLAFTMLAGQWIAFALGAVGSLILLLTKGFLGLESISSIAWNNTNSYVLIAVPLFILMGELIVRSGAGRNFYSGVATLMGSARGGLLHANTVSCAVFAAVSGSSVATAASVGTVAIPEMLKQGYDKKLVFGSLAAGGTLGILIPPSLSMVLYGALVGESISHLFIAGIIPGLLLTSIFLIYGFCRIRLNPSLAPQASENTRRPSKLAALPQVLPITALIVVVLGGIYSGYTTPTEAAAVGAFGAFVLAACYGRFNWMVCRDSLLSTVKLTCMIMFLIVGAQILSAALTYSGINKEITDWILHIGLSKWAFFCVIVIFFLALGMFVDGVSMMFLTLPVLFPAITAFGFDAVWFGVVLTVLIELGQITPPVGLNLFTIQAISGGKNFRDVAMGAAPYCGLILFLLVLLAFFPALATWLPTTIR